MKIIFRIALILAFVFPCGMAFGQTIGETFRANLFFCQSPQDLVEAAQGAAQGIDRQKLAEQKCTRAFADFTVKRSIGDFNLSENAKLFIVELEADYKGRWYTVYVAWAHPLQPRSLYIDVTWKPEYSKNPQAVIDWFQAQKVKGGMQGTAYHRLGIVDCCNNAERLRTKFVGVNGKEWAYYPDPNCIVKGCLLLPVPDDVVHEEEIRPLNPDAENDPATHEAFEEMRKEGVIMIYNGVPSCFWPPTESGG